MSYRSGIITGFLLAVLLAGGSYGGWRLLNGQAIATEKSLPPSIPAKVQNPLKEELINTITLTPEAEQRLALQTAQVERKQIRRSRSYGGEAFVPPGQSVIVSSPLNGILRTASKGLPIAGQMVKQGQPMFELLALLTPEGRANLATSKVDADGQVKNGESQLEAATIALNRAKELFKGEAGSKRQVDEAQAQFELSQKSLDAVKARRDLLAKVMGELDKGTAAPITIDAPITGILRNINVRDGQHIPAGALLFEILDPSYTWIRVPVYVGDLKDLDTSAPATITTLTAATDAEGIEARPIQAPPTANSIAGTVDLYYWLDNQVTKFSPGHRVGVRLPQNDASENLVLPCSAMVHDIHGGTWVYERTAPHTYVRRRILVKFVKDGVAILSNGPAVGTKVVTSGAAELFGTETGFSK